MTVLDRSPAGLGRMTVLLAEDGDAPVPGLPAWVRDWAVGAGAATEDASGSAPDVAVSRVFRTHRGAVLLLRRDPAGPPRRIVAAVQEHEADRPVVAAAASAATACRAGLRIVHAVPRSFGERSVGLAEAVERGHRLVASVGGAEELGVTVRRDLVRAWPHEILDETLDADLLVVGGPRPNGPAELGLTARAAVVHAQCSVLVVPRAG
ncbi:universal stress protein [Pseudonocardia lutea]|jgi:nucleotide-binding universal stress UspA family protein|uniref:Universal stress protein n=1 Tax=Pseudonocardia lutea TaxID=2172015 RepID=A0ABW1IEB0_9PSEU